ncbi:MAG TPA: hypothetical protein VNO21_05460, partial [Polyangiaceae bacterium]|nr:hypothetical protein [Polyangiaceae bacterium]
VQLTVACAIARDEPVNTNHSARRDTIAHRWRVDMPGAGSNPGAKAFAVAFRVNQRGRANRAIMVMGDP